MYRKKLTILSLRILARAAWMFVAFLPVLTGSCAASDDDNEAEVLIDDDTVDDTAVADDSAPDDDHWMEKRSFHMAAAPVQFAFREYWAGIVFDTTGFDGRVDAISLHQDFFGLPWDEFASGAALPAAWVSEMTEIRDMAEALGAPIYLSLTPLDGMRSTLAPKATDQGGELVLVENWAAPCFNFETGESAPALRRAYLDYAKWMVDFFEPRWLTNVIEMNLFYVSCPDAYGPLIDVANAVYDQEKSWRPGLIVFPTFVIDALYGYGGNGNCEVGDFSCLEDSLALNAGVRRDRIGISSYPLHMSYEWTRIPDDYFSLIADMSGERVVFGETGWATHPVWIPTEENPTECWRIFDTSDADQIDYMRYLFEQADAMGSDLVTWWSLRDYLPREMLDNCPCDAPGLWCTLYDAVEQTGLLPAWLGWGSMGVLDYDLNAKPSLEFWNEWLARPIK